MISESPPTVIFLVSQCERTGCGTLEDPSAGAMDIDEALRVVDPKNRLQWIYLVVVSAQAVPGAMVLLAMEFVGKILHHGTGYEATYSNAHLNSQQNFIPRPNGIFRTLPSDREGGGESVPTLMLSAKLLDRFSIRDRNLVAKGLNLPSILQHFN